MSLRLYLRQFFHQNGRNNSSIRYMCKSIIASNDSNVAPPDLLMNNIKHVTSTNQVLNLVNQHANVMNSEHVIQALKSLFVLQKEGRSEISPGEIIQNNNFERLCKKLKSFTGVLELKETVEALKVLTYLGVPANSTIVQMLLQLIRQNINDLSLNQIIFLQFLLLNISKASPLTEALKIALPIVYEIQLPIKLDRENIHSLREHLLYAVRNNLSTKTKDLILSSMLKCSDQLDGRSAKSIVWALAEMPNSPYTAEILKKCFDIILFHLDQLSNEELDITLTRIAGAYNQDCPYFRNRSFCDVVAENNVKYFPDFVNISYTIKKMDRLEVINKPLIDHAAKLIEEMRTENLYNLYLFTKYISKSPYRPPNWIIVKSVLENIELDSKFNYLKLAASFCSLEIFNVELLKRCFYDDFDLIVKSRRGYVYLYLRIYHSIKLMRPDLLPLLPRTIKPADLIKYMKIPSSYTLQGALYSAFGGENYVKTGLFSKNGVLVDHVIVFRKGGYPVASNFVSTFVEDLELDEGNQLVAIIAMPRDLYTVDNYLKRGPHLGFKLLENSGITVVPISLKTWYNLADYENIPYLVQQIKDKLGPDMIITKHCS